MTCWIGLGPGLIDALGLAVELGGDPDALTLGPGPAAPSVPPLGQNCHSANNATMTITTTVARRRAIWLRVGRRRFDRRMIGGPPFCTARVYGADGPWASSRRDANNTRSRVAIACAPAASATLCSCHVSVAR